MATRAAKASDTRRTRSVQALTDKFVRDATSEKRSSRIFYDAKISGFGIRVQKTGRKAFVFNYVAGGRERRITIGRYPAWSVAAARDQAAKLRRDVDAGGDPLETRERTRGAQTLNQLWSQYRDEVSAKKRPATHKNEISVWTRLILPVLGSRKLEDIKPGDVDRLHASISMTAPVQANRVLATLRHAYNTAIRWGLAASNPVIGTRQNPEEGRERYLTSIELRALTRALESRGNNASALALRFIIATGCRKGEALSATWEQFDREAEIWTKPSSPTKQKRVHRVPFNRTASTILDAASDIRVSAAVFPGKDGKPLVDVKRTFQAACKEAGITGLRIHDLRHTFASHLASAGTSLPIVGALLGHTQTSTTARYAHLLDQPLRDATEILSDTISGAK